MREGAFVWIQKSCVFGATLCFFIKTFQLHTSKSDLCVGMNLSIYLAISILDIKQLPSCLRPMYPLYTFSNNHDISGMWGPSHDWRFPLKVLVIWNRDIPPTLWEESGLRVYDVRPLVTFATHWPKKGCEQKQIPVGDFLQLPPWTWITCFGKGIYIYIYYIPPFKEMAIFDIDLIDWSIFLELEIHPLKNSRVTDHFQSSIHDPPGWWCSNLRPHFRCSEGTPGFRKWMDQWWTESRGYNLQLTCFF